MQNIISLGYYISVSITWINEFLIHQEETDPNGLKDPIHRNYHKRHVLNTVQLRWVSGNAVLLGERSVFDEARWIYVQRLVVMIANMLSTRPFFLHRFSPTVSPTSLPLPPSSFPLQLLQTCELWPNNPHQSERNIAPRNYNLMTSQQVPPRPVQPLLGTMGAIRLTIHDTFMIIFHWTTCIGTLYIMTAYRT